MAKIKEIWKDIQDFPNYQISNIGRVRPKRKFRFCIKKQTISNVGYLMTSFYYNNKMNNVTVHRLVAKAFIPNPYKKPCVNHKNGIKTDNRASNLEWVTYKENMRHAVTIGSVKNGENSHMSKIKFSDVIKIRELYGKITTEEIGEIFNVHPGTIERIANRRSRIKV